MSLFDALFLDPAPYHIWIANRTDGLKGSGTVSQPYHGGLVGGVSQFDTIMNLVSQPNAVIHIGPGTFVTKGFVDDVGGWQLKSGMKIYGSGIDTTILQIDNSSVGTNRHVFAISHPVKTGTQAGTQVDAVEVAELSIDCNLGGPTNSAFGGIRILGNNTRVRQVQISKWGTKSTSVPAFGIVCLTGDPSGAVYGVDNVGIENCYAILPDYGVAGGYATAFSIGWWDYAAWTAREAEGKSPFIRNCYINGSNPVNSAFTPSATLPHASRSTIIGISVCWCKGAIIEGNQIYNVDVAGPYQKNKSIRDGVFRNNFARNVALGTLLDVGQLATKINGSGNASITAASNVGTVSGGGINMSTSGVTPGDRISLSTASSFAGTYLVTSIDTVGNKFTVITTAATGSDSAITDVQRVLSVGRSTIEGNSYEHPVGSTPSVSIQVWDNQSVGSAKLPDYTNGDIIIRDNKFRLIDAQVPVSTDTAYGLELRGAKNVQVSNCVVDLYKKTFPSTPQPLQNIRCGNVTYFNDRTPGGALIQGFRQDTPVKLYDELETLTDDALIVSFLDQ